MKTSGPDAWDVVVVPSPSLSRTSQDIPAVAHSEWIRLLLGRALAPVRIIGNGDAPQEVQYLVTGVQVGEFGDPLHRAEASRAVEAGLAAIEDSINCHRRDIVRVHQEGWQTQPERFVAAYALLTAVTVSTDPADWVATDEGLFIVRWGLEGPKFRPLLRFSAQDLGAIRAALMSRLSQPVAARTVPGGSDVSLVARQAVYESGFRPTKEAVVTKQPPPSQKPRRTATTSGRAGGPMSGVPKPVYQPNPPRKLKAKGLPSVRVVLVLTGVLLLLVAAGIAVRLLRPASRPTPAGTVVAPALSSTKPLPTPPPAAAPRSAGAEIESP